jgi:hypothetical protein
MYLYTMDVDFLHKKIEKYTILEILSQIDVNKSELYNILDKFQNLNCQIKCTTLA